MVVVVDKIMNVGGGGGKAPITVGINPTIVFYSLVLGGACALASYTERYRRDQDEIDDRLKERYFSNIQEQQAKMPLITQTIRGQDARLDDAMNKWVWGGKADLSASTTGSGGGNTSKATLVVKSSNDDDEPSSASSDEDESSDSDSGSSSSSSISEEELEQEKMLSKKERRQRRKERKQRREARRKKREEEKRRLEAEREKLVLQSVAAGVAVGAVAVAVTMLVGNRPK